MSAQESDTWHAEAGLPEAVVTEGSSGAVSVAALANRHNVKYSSLIDTHLSPTVQHLF